MFWGVKPFYSSYRDRIIFQISTNAFCSNILIVCFVTRFELDITRLQSRENLLSLVRTRKENDESENNDHSYFSIVPRGLY